MRRSYAALRSLWPRPICSTGACRTTITRKGMVFRKCHEMAIPSSFPPSSLVRMGDEHVRAAYEARATEYRSILGSVGDMHELDRLRIEQWAKPIEGSVLDIGCGPGHWTDLLHRDGVDIQGVDLVPEFINSARARFPGVPFRVASLRTLDVPESSLQGVLAWYSSPAGSLEVYDGVSTPLHRYAPVEMSVDAGASETDFRSRLYELALDCVNQGGLSSLRLIEEP